MWKERKKEKREDIKLKKTEGNRDGTDAIKLIRNNLSTGKLAF